MPEITVVITTYNLEHHLPNRLAELEKQTFQGFDLILLDDCSTDGTWEIVRAAAEKSPEHIRGIAGKHNLGCPALTRNAVLNSGLIDGNYVVFLDGDDAIEPDFLEKLYTCAQLTQADIVSCAYDRVEQETGHVLSREMHGFPHTVMLPPTDDTIAFINTSLWNKLIRTSLIGDTRIPDFRVGEDMSFLQILYSKATKLAFIDNILIHYQVHSTSVISNTSEATIHSFAYELQRQLSENSNTEMKSILELTTFIHIGISMAMRAYDNSNVDIQSHLKWTKQYLYDNALLSNAKYLRLHSLSAHGVKGIAVWCCKLFYKLNCMLPFLWLLKTVKTILHMDFKF